MRKKLPARIRQILKPVISTIFYYTPNADYRQLRMQITQLDNLPNQTPPPTRYAIRTYHKGDETAWINIIRSAFGEKFADDPEIVLNDILNKPGFDPESFFIAAYNGEPVGAAIALTVPNGPTNVGYINLVAVRPEHQGKQLGKILTLAALYYFKKNGPKTAILDTDDYRLQAIKTYLALGFTPVYLNREHKKRWVKVIKEINKKPVSNK
jgi:mycothiol synthase